MYGLLLAIIYIAFISLGLPDPLLGAAWPVMYAELGACIMPPLCGILLERVSMSLYPVILLFVTVLIWISFEALHRIVTNKR
jgi:fucose permease